MRLHLRRFVLKTEISERTQKARVQLGASNPQRPVAPQLIGLPFIRSDIAAPSVLGVVAGITALVLRQQVT